MIITPVQEGKAQVLHPSPPEPVIVQRMGQIDEPPPYVAGQTSASLPLQAPSPVVPTVPSQFQRLVSSSTLRIPPAPPPRRSSPIKREILATNFLFLCTRKEPIQGIFHIDPDLPVVELAKTGKLAVDRQLYNQKHKQKHRHHTKKNKRVANQTPHAIFQSKSGDISLDLALVSPPLHGISTALIQASSKKGNIDIIIPFIHSQRRLNLEVRTSHGNILILIPRSFSGYIQAYSKDGKLVFLPHITTALNIISRRDRESQVVVGDAVYNPPRPGVDWTGDTIHVASRDGNIYIGYTNEDRKPIEETGFWKKVIDNMVDVVAKRVVHPILQ